MSVVLKNARCKIYLFGDVLEKNVLWENVFLGSFDFKSSHVFFVIFWRSQSYLLKYLEYKIFGINLVYKKNKRAKKTEFLMVFIERKKKKYVYPQKNTLLKIQKKCCCFESLKKIQSQS